LVMDSRFLVLFLVFSSFLAVEARVLDTSSPDLCERRCMTSTIRECSPADFMLGYEGATTACLRCLDQCNGKVQDDLSALWR
ncbi:hypothetical protein PMAYCL1PPCAC_16275, partial [Pristionchus mayeri]